jgi:ribA/ribD-fused uncharacterized protein
MKIISEFRGPNNFLSNFYSSKFSTDDIVFMSQMFAEIFQTKITFKTNEHFYQCVKADSEEQRILIAEAATPADARREGRKCSRRKDFPQVMDFVMKAGLCAKFTKHEDLKQKLIATFPAMLIEGNRWKDTYWGFDYNLGLGQNRLGIILMELRTVLMDMK